MPRNTVDVPRLIQASKSQSFRMLNAHLLGAGLPAVTQPSAQADKRIRQREGDGMNKTERAFFEYLQATYPGVPVHREISLPLANGCRYKPDFITAHTNGGAREIRGWEVKGFARDDAVAKLKMAARVYPWIRFQLVWLDSGAWHFQDIHP